MTTLANNRFAHYIGYFLSHLLPLVMGEGKVGGGRLEPYPPT